MKKFFFLAALVLVACAFFYWRGRIYSLLEKAFGCLRSYEACRCTYCPGRGAAGAPIRVETGVESIAQGLDSLFSMSDADLKEMGTRGKELVRQKFTWQTVAEEMKQVYDWMLGGGTRPGSVIASR